MDEKRRRRGAFHGIHELMAQMESPASADPGKIEELEA
jgi:hypothetical protein